ncbi:MAG: phosphopantetheine-binding protein [Brachymonas sp.]|nr:phosphopantetheine-binding protein [Brachymonas sp.]
MTHSSDDVQALLPELAELVVNAVNLEMDPASIDPDAPLYREGLGLDSIDILEIALVVARKYGAQIKAGDADNARVFGSLRALAQYIVANRPKG